MKIDGANPFVQRNVVEGDEFFQEFYLKNKGTIDFDYKIFTENVSGDLCGQLNVKAKAEGEEIFDGKLEDFSYSDNLKAGKNINWKLELKVGDGDWEEKCKFDVYFNAWQKNFSFKQGWNDAEEISGNEIVFIDEPKKRVIINEVMWMGSTASSSDEWIELRNLSDEKIDIGGWEIENARSSGSSLKIPGGKSIDSNGYFLISNYSDESANSVLAVEVDEVNSSISLSNFGNGNLVLKNEKENIEDEVMGIEWFFGENGNNKK
ncbi:MAG: Phospholipase D/competence protein ComEA helix-hairpin-helix domain protein [Candidatus Moranbacteria bacterium GW2011_GWD2_37_9]|nr:MAG: Phospholipase D/competence protein ComEA helix-hairpin-helix domain protein [Candidatus Moranbacteria bacterium GW2011_GWD2_37_9]